MIAKQCNGSMAERSKAPVLGTGLRARVRIPLLSKILGGKGKGKGRGKEGKKRPRTSLSTFWEVSTTLSEH